MGSLKALTLAGVVAVAAIQTAQAADLLPPPPPIEAPPLRGPIEDSGFYVRVDAGLANTNASGLRSTFDSPWTESSLSASYGPVSVGDSGIVGLGAGYQFNSWFRADVTGEYRNAVSYHASQTYQNAAYANCNPANGTICGDAYTGQVKTGLFLANGYLDMGSWYGFTPYVGGGVGVAAYQTSGITDNSVWPLGGFGFAANHSGTNFAWALMAGASYHITPNLLLDAGYRYVNMGTLSTGAISCGATPCFHEVQHFDMYSNDVRVGLRWLLAGPVYSAPLVSAKY